MTAVDCIRCPLHLTRHQVVQAKDTPSDILFILPAPNAQHDRLGEFGGSQWERLFTSLLDATGLSPYAGFTSLVHCRPPKDRKPRREEVQECRVWLREDVWEAAPKVIVTLGQEALEGVLSSETYRPTKPQNPLGNCHGSVVGEWLGVPVLATYHPASVARNTKLRRALVGDLQVVAGMLGLKSQRPCDDWALNPYYLWGLIPEAIALDVETDQQQNLLGVGVAWREDGRIKAAYADYGTYSCEKLLSEVGRLIEVDSGMVVCHNAKFDIPILQAHGIDISPTNVDDTMIMAFDLRRNQTTGSLGLKELASVDLGMTWPTIEQLGLPEDMSLEEVAEYCCQDAAATLLLYELYKKELQDELL